MGKVISIWLAINKSGFIGLYKDCPIKNEKTGKWEGKYPIINSVIYDNITDLIQKSSLSWESEPEYISIKLEWKI